MRAMKAHDLFVLLATMALASLLAAPTWADAVAAATPGSTDTSTPVLAVYSGGGKITATQAEAKAKEMAGPGRGVVTFSTPENMYETAAKQLALRAIFLKKASDLELEKKPGWPVAEKLIESEALSNIMMDIAWFSVTPAEPEIDKFIKDNPDMVHPPSAAKGVDTTKAAATGWQAPNEHDFAAWQIRGESATPLINALIDEAKNKHQVICSEFPVWQKAKDDTVLVRCGSITLTGKDIKELSDVAGKKIEWCSQIYAIDNSSDGTLPQGDLARDKQYDKRPEFAAALQAAKDAWLAAVAKSRIVEEMLDKYTPSEAEIKDYYDNQYKAQQDQIIKSDAIVCPISGSSGGDTAKALAAEIIMKIQQGAKFDDMVKQHPECRYMGPSTKYVRPDTSGGFDSPAISGVAAGGVALEPVEDNGGFCVVRVLDNSPRQKIPLQYARGAVVDAIRFDRTRQITMAADGVDGAILERYGFTVQKDVLAQVSRQK
jgi:hypothetical protein